MHAEAERLAERFLDFAAKVVEVVDDLPNTMIGHHLGNQLLRSGTSSAANYEEACAGESRADFIHKLKISLKELRETRFWLRLMLRTRLHMAKGLDSLAREANELCNIVARSVITAKAKPVK